MFFGRDDLILQLNGLWRKRVSSLVTCRGRRRVGKSTLIREFSRTTQSRFIKIEGARPDAKTTRDDELRVFAEQLAAQTGCEDTPPSNWLNAFIRLASQIRDDERTVILLDEISWLGFGEPMFADIFRIAWENYLKQHDRLVVVLCGSVSSWVKENFIDNRAYVGRRSLDVVVNELPPHECVRFWGEAVSRLATREIIDVLSVTGGVPRYLEEIDPALPASENIRNLAFLPKSVLRVDFEEMFPDVVTRQPKFAAMAARTLVDGPKSVTEIAAALDTEKSGRISSALKELEEAGFVASDPGRNPETGTTVRSCRYRLKDNYTRFYLKYVEPAKETIDAGSFAFAGLEQFAGWQSIMGLQFENLVINNYRSLLPRLGLDRSLLLSAAPYRRIASEKSRRKGVQIDLLLQTRMSFCLVEIKRQREIGREVIDEMREKVRRFAAPSGTSVRTALVFDGELAPSVEADGYFDAIVPFRQLLGL